MPTMPTFDVSQAQADRLLTVYGSVDNYLEWLKGAIRRHVLETETNRLHQQQEQDMLNLRAELDAMGLI